MKKKILLVQKFRVGYCPIVLEKKNLDEENHFLRFYSEEN